MKIILTSCFCDYNLVDGKEAPSALITRNGLSDAFKSVWIDDAHILIICSDPDNFRENDELLDRMKNTFLMSGLSVSTIDLCDKRSINAIDNLSGIDILVLSGGHVPTQNKFIKEIKLRERLNTYRGNIVALSAGSMNCADVVYAIPEKHGEATDPAYKRWLSGLGLTDINIFPHYQYLRNVYLDGLCMADDIAFPDSIGKEIVALNDGSYILLSEGRATIYVESYMIKDGKIFPLCNDGESYSLS